MAQNKQEQSSNQNPMGWLQRLARHQRRRSPRFFTSHFRVVKIGNKNCSLNPLIGCAFGSLFQVEDGNKGPYLSLVLPTSEGNNNEETKDYQIKDELKDNRALVDNNKAQSLSGEDIDALQRQGATGHEIVEALIANSSTFEKKTSFSQEKYRLKNRKSTHPRCTALVSLFFLTSLLFLSVYARHTSRNIRKELVSCEWDTLSLLLSVANITANSDVLVVDKIGGIISGAVMERLGGTGYVCNTYLGATPYPIEIVRIFNFGDEICKRIVRSSLSDLSGGHKEAPEHSGLVEDTSIIESQPDDKSTLSPSSSHSVSMDETPVSSGNGLLKLNNETAVPKACKPTKAGEKAQQKTINLWRENGFSSLLIAAPDMDAWSIVKEVLLLLSYSAPFAIYHQYLQPLATCMHNLQLERMAIGLQISEPWLREYQVLPSKKPSTYADEHFRGVRTEWYQNM